MSQRASSPSGLANILSVLPSDSSLSLRQLVGVNDALLTSYGLLSTAASADAGDEVSRVEARLAKLLGEDASHPEQLSVAFTTEDVVQMLLGDNKEEAKVCLDALIGRGASNDEAEKIIVARRALLVAQYLLRLARSASSSSSGNSSGNNGISALLNGLNHVALPLLLRPCAAASNDTSDGEEQGDNDDDANKSTPVLMDWNVRDAIIEAAFASSCSLASTLDGSDNGERSTADGDALNKQMERCANDCVISVRESLCIGNAAVLDRRMGVETCAKILVRLLNLCEDHNELLDEEIILRGVHDVFLEVAKFICSSGDLRLLRPLTGLLLPILWGDERNSSSNKDENGKKEARAAELWAFLSNILEPAADEVENKKRCHNWNDVAPMIVTGILCSSIQGLAAYPLPSSLGSDDKIPLSHNVELWEFIKLTLQRMGDGQGGGGMKTGGSFASTGLAADADASAVDQILRRRAIHILRLLVEYEEKGHNNNNPADRELVLTWKKYVLTYEALEMENELHLVEQVWPTTTELCAACSKGEHSTTTSTAANSIPTMSCEWVGSLLARVLLSESPTLKKLALYRFLSGDAGVSATAPKFDPAQAQAPAEAGKQQTTKSVQAKKGKKKGGGGKKKKAGGSKKPAAQPARLSIVSPSFVTSVLLPAYDSLFASVGTNIHIDVNNKVVSDDLNPRLQKFIKDYMRILREDKPEMLGEFVAGLLSERFISSIRHRPLAQIYQAVGDAAAGTDEASKLSLPRNVVEEAALSFKETFANGGTLHKIRETILANFAKLLANSKGVDQANPQLILGVLELYQSPITSMPRADGERSESQDKDTSYYRDIAAANLQTWVGNAGGQQDWAAEAGAACASAYISGHLLPFHAGVRANSGRLYVGKIEREMGASIVKLCALAGGASSSKSPSEMLWPAINKGLAQAVPFIPSNTTNEAAQVTMPPEVKAKVARAIVLLDHGCIERILNGLGHGDLVVDKSGSMLPPPSEIENLLSTAVGVILSQIRLIVSCRGEADLEHTQQDATSGGPRVATRSRVTGELSSGLARWCDCLKTLCDAFPSSIILERTANNLLLKALDDLMDVSAQEESESSAESQMRNAHLLAMVYAALTCGGEYNAPSDTSNTRGGRKGSIEACEFILRANFTIPAGDLGAGYTKMQMKAARSLFQYAKWGSLSYLVPMTYVDGISDSPELRAFHGGVLDAAADAIHSTPENALLPLFEAALGAARLSVGALQQSDGHDKSENLLSYSKHINRIVDALFSVLSETAHGPTRIYMINSACALLFRPRLIMNEYEVNLESEIADDGSNDTWPIRKAFHMLLELAVRKPHIAKAAVSYISAAWLGADTDEGRQSMGLAALPYRNEIAKLLVYKEERVDDAAAFQNLPITMSRSNAQILDDIDALSVPSRTNDTSLVRGFLLVFFSKLLDPCDGLDEKVLTELCHFIILNLLNSMFTEQPKSSSTSFITGSPEYCHKIRAWQALCILHRFVTDEIAEEVADKVYKTMEQNLHGQIRYFQEIFAIQCHRKHQRVFLKKFVSEVRRCDLSQQHVSSLMIVGGNLIVGRYSKEFFAEFSEEEVKNPLNEVLAGTLPWLSATQGFARGIAQLLVHKITPLVIQLDAEVSTTDWYLHTMFNFLDKNSDMARLRKKQSKFFESYDADPVCTPEGILSIPVDVGDEADPAHMVRIIKRCLEEVYEEAHETDAPQWKQVKAALNYIENAAEDDSDDVDDSDEALIGFQRKIVPLDSLNLSLEESREQSLRNAAGRRRQELIVCATFVDKIPNLGGLARTAEIFAADRLVIPDKRVVKMDNFKNISVSAGDWIPIDEVKETDLMKWLKEKKSEGYTIVGIEQTSSSTCLSRHKFASKSVLLLGKEKEGIPVEYLQLVDTCLEVPQLGIIRSLNVHVTGAISIWEYTKQQLESQE